MFWFSHFLYTEKGLIENFLTGILLEKESEESSLLFRYISPTKVLYAINSFKYLNIPICRLVFSMVEFLFTFES